MMKKNLLFSIICSLILMQPLMAQEDALELEEVEEQQVEPAIPESELQEVKPSAMLSWWQSLRRPTMEDLQNARSYVNSKYRCMWYGEGCSRKERAVLGTLAAAAGVAVGTATARWGFKRRRKKRAAERAREAESAAREERKKKILDEEVEQWLDYAYEGNLAEIQRMIKEGININLRDKWGYTALMKASAMERPATVEALLEAEAKVDLQNEWGQTALIWAALLGRTATVEVLLNAGADWTIKNKQGKTAYYFAKDEEIKRLIKEKMEEG